MRINANIEGLLNWIDDNFIAQCTGYGIYTTYRFYDSWIVNNNIGSRGPNLSIESGPVRIIANHLDGEPSNNIELRGCKSLNIIGNICENARKEAIVFAMPSWMDSDNEQVAIVGNNITNGGKADPNAYPAIGIYSVDSDHRTMGFNITGNFIANVDEGAGWSYAVDALPEPDRYRWPSRRVHLGGRVLPGSKQAGTKLVDPPLGISTVE